MANIKVKFNLPFSNSIDNSMPDLTDMNNVSLPLAHESGTFITLNGTTAGNKAPIGAISNGTEASISSPIGLTACGKNFFKNSLVVGASGTAPNGLAYVVNSDKSITFNGTVSANSEFTPIKSVSYIKLAVGTVLKLSSTVYGGLAIYPIVTVVYADSTIAYIVALSSVATFTISKPINYIQFSIGTNTSIGVEVNNVTISPQLEIATATTYEVYNGTDYSIPIKDTAGTVLSLAPTESIALNLADGKWYIGATELHADTKTAIESVVELATLTNVFNTSGAIIDTTYRIESTANDGADLYLFGTPLPSLLTLGSDGGYNGYRWSEITNSTPETLGDYTATALTLYFDSIDEFETVTVHFDKLAGQWATRAYLDGVEADIFYSDDVQWDIQWGNAS